MTRAYQRKSKTDLLKHLKAQIDRLEAAHTKRYEFIGKLREKAQRLENALTVTPEVPHA